MYVQFIEYILHFTLKYTVQTITRTECPADLYCKHWKPPVETPSVTNGPQEPVRNGKSLHSLTVKWANPRSSITTIISRPLSAQVCKRIMDASPNLFNECFLIPLW